MVLVLFLSTIAVEPADGFLANVQAMQVTMRFEFRSGLARSDQICEGAIWRTGRIAFESENAERFVTGEWATDGSVEYFRNEPSAQVLERRNADFQEGVRRFSFSKPFELLVDHEIVADHSLALPVVNVLPRGHQSLRHRARGPLCWWSERFVDLVAGNFRGAETRTVEAVIGGFATECAIYNTPDPAGESQHEFVVAFDPAIGFLPRFARVLHRNTKRPSRVREFYLLDCRGVNKGTFLPLEWIETDFVVNDFDASYPRFDHTTQFRPAPDANILVGHFKATQVDDKPPVLRLRQKDGFVKLLSQGGSETLHDRPTQLTLTDLKASLGSRIFNPVRKRVSKMPIVQASLARPWWVWAVATGLFGISLWLALAARREHKAALTFALLALVNAAGCSKQPTVPRIEASFTATHLLIPAGPVNETVPLRLHNAGNCPLRIDKLDTGCTCALAEDSPFPFELAQGQSRDVAIKLRRNGDYTAQRLIWTFDTDRGRLQASSDIFVIPEAQIRPSNLGYRHLAEGERGSFELVTQEVQRTPAAWQDATLTLPAGLVATIVSSRSGDGPVDGFQFREATYSVAIEDNTLGERRESIVLRQQDGKELVTAVVHWKRSPAVSTVPDRVRLAHQKVRVFLRSSFAAEFVKVRAAPAGIDAQITSPIELCVTPMPNASDELRGEIVVETSASTTPVLRIPVTRYVASTARAAATPIGN